uniref:Uncharacterized protein n=1 Tax=Arundo donax TaxID=35708 RepID=A0A0A8XYK3_ARUDO
MTHLAMLKGQGWNCWQPHLKHRWKHLRIILILRKIQPKKETLVTLTILTCLGEVGGIHVHHHI